MTRHWTFGQKIGAAFATIVVLTFAIGTVSVVTLRSMAATKDRILAVNAQQAITGTGLRVASERRARWLREYLLTGNPQALQDLTHARADFAGLMNDLRRAATTNGERQLLQAVGQTDDTRRRATDALIVRRQAGEGIVSLSASFATTLAPVTIAVDNAIGAFLAELSRVAASTTRNESRSASRAVVVVIAISLILAVLIAVMAFLLSRSLNRQIGGSVGQVQSSSAELQAASTQQAVGVREQATAMNEITTTTAELLATSRQIAQSAQHVAEISQHTAEAARSGEATVEHAHESISAIRGQVDLVVGHMLELGEKSQQVGAVLEIVAELAEQTNILAINATIEAAGAGEAGTRFAVVADEIRKLADRVAGSTKEIRDLIEEVRSAVNTTIMATETGSKGVDTGARQFGEVSTSFRQIAELVGTTTDAAREIELSTKQQTGGVEQVNIAVANVSQAMKEAEVSSGQTQQTAAQLVIVSRDLLRLVHTEAGP